MPNVETGAGDAAANMGVIHTTLLMVTAHCQLSIQAPGQKAVMIPSTEDILAYGDDCSSKLQHSGNVVEYEFVQADGDKGGELFGAEEPENAAIVQATSEYIREEFRKAEMVNQLARGELVSEMSPVPVESGEKDVDVTVKKEKLKKDDSQDVGIEEFEDLPEHICDVLFAIKKEKACLAAVEFYDIFFKCFSKKLVIKTFDDYHHHSVNDVYEAVRRASKIMVYVAPVCHDKMCPQCSPNKEEKKVYREKLFQELSATISDKKDYQHIVTVTQKKSFKFMSKLCKDQPLLRYATRLHYAGLGADVVGALLNDQHIEQIIEKREQTVKFALQHEEKKKEKSDESKHERPSVILPLNRSSSDEKNGSPDSRIEYFDLDTDERTDVLILCCVGEEDLTGPLQERIREIGRSLKIGTPERFHWLGIEKTQRAIENADKVIIYASCAYAKDPSMIKALDLEKAIDDIQGKLVIVVPRGTTKADYDAYKEDLKLVSAVAAYFEDKIEDMKPLIKWFSPKGQAQFCSYG